MKPMQARVAIAAAGMMILVRPTLSEIVPEEIVKGSRAV